MSHFHSHSYSPGDSRSIGIAIAIIGITQQPRLHLVCACLTIWLRLRKRIQFVDHYPVRETFPGNPFAQKHVMSAPELSTGAEAAYNCNWHCKWSFQLLLLITQNHSEWVFSSDNLNTFHFMPVSWGGGEGVESESIPWFVCSASWTFSRLADWQPLCQLAARQ